MSDDADPPLVIRRAEIRDGRRYLDGVDVGPAQPETFGMHRNNEAGRARRAKRPRPHRSRR